MSQTGRSSTARVVVAAAAAMTLFMLPSVARAAGDWPCTSTADCPAYSSTGQISDNSTCVADPVNPEYGYCGYAGAPCGTDFDCDYGKCTEGKCSGYMGDSCEEQLDCMAWYSCGTDKVCGGAGATCENGNEDCFSNSCSGGTAGTCAVAPRAGMPEGSGCSRDVNCVTGSCDTEAFICAARVAAAPGASQGARAKAKRNGNGNGNGHNPKERRGRIHAWFKSHQFCPLGQTACGTASGFECVDTLRTLESCGGCPPIYATNTTTEVIGTDCTSLPNVDEVICSNGHCTILSCSGGFMLSEDGRACGPLKL